MSFVPPSSHIKFKFTLTPSGTVIEFPAYLQDISVQVGPSWDSFNEIGRADGKYIYNTFSKTLSISFLVVAESGGGVTISNTGGVTSRRGNFFSAGTTIYETFDNLENLAKSISPYYQGNGYVGQFIIFTVGEIYVNEVGYVSSLGYDWDNTSTTWDLDEQLPLLTNVNISINWVGRSMARGTTSYFSLSKG